MKTSKGTICVLTLTLTLLFTGCAKDTPPNEDTEKTGQSLETEAPRQAQGEVTDGGTAEGGGESRNASETPDLTEDNETTAPALPEDNKAAAPALSEDALARIRSAADEYYASIHHYKIRSFAQADPESPYRRPEYEKRYDPSETAVFEIFVENNHFQRYIVVGSRDGWNHCRVLYEIVLKDPNKEKMDTVKAHAAEAYPELSEAEQARKAEELYQEEYIRVVTPEEIVDRYGVYYGAWITSEEVLARIRTTAEGYYAVTNHKIFSFTQADMASSLRRRSGIYYEEYEPEELALFEIVLESEKDLMRYMTVGSNDGWDTYSILSEGY